MRLSLVRVLRLRFWRVEVIIILDLSHSEKLKSDMRTFSYWAISESNLNSKLDTYTITLPPISPFIDRK